MPKTLRALASLAAVSAITLGGGLASAQPAWGPLAPPNPFLGPVGTSTMHGDAGSSDATPLAGPGSGDVGVTGIPLLSACPTLLQGSDGRVLALCTAIAGQTPTVHLFDADVTKSVASLKLAKGSLLGGVYAFLDNQNRLVAVDGDRKLQRIGHTANTLFVDSTVDLSGAVPADDAVTGLVPDWAGNIWFATGGGVIGAVDSAGVARTVRVPAGEQVQNSISSSPDGVSVATTHALYQLSLASDGTPRIDWRQAYDRGSARKPGQLSWGTGSTPTYFGPATGHEYVAIVDSADTRVNLIVRRVSTGEQVCQIPVLASGGPGSENSPIGIGNSVFVASTYGYPYPKVPEGAGPAVPASAPFTGGMTRVDLDGSGCHVVWDNAVRSSAVPHLSTADGLIYTVLREGAPTTTPLDGFAFAAIDPATGAVLRKSSMGITAANDTLQMSALITPRGDYLQGTITGVQRVRAGGGLGSLGSVGSLGSSGSSGS
ncbi:hypothetical protein [Rhodococcus sp. NPDC058514]|uniref:hypothetical protein n=1 Tax=unclassified Rhodococcus (in: high G+C Gram-positive bacteria) TaxID=192944 RepID=UPI003646F90C